MIKKLLLFSVFTLFINVGSYAQMDTNQKAKLYFQEAQKWFNQNDYEEALKYIVKAEQTLGGTNGRILNLKIKTLYNQGKFVEAEDALMLFSSAFEDSVTEELKNDTYSYFVRIDKAASVIKEKKAEEERVKEAARLAEEKKLNGARAKALPQIKETLYTFSKLEEGRPYLVTYRKTLTSSTTEKAYFVFYGNKYVIYTVPSIDIYKKLDKEEQNFNSYAAGTGSNTIGANVKASYGGKIDVSFRKGVNFSNVYLGGAGDELLWTSGTQNTQFDKRLHYYYYKTGYSVDIDMKDDFQEHYYNPYVETGKITKTVDYDLINDSSLKNKLKNEGISHKQTTSYTSPRGLEIKLVPSKNMKMILPTKKITYYLKDEINKYAQDGAKYKGTLLYYGVKTKSNHYGFVQYGKWYNPKDLLSAITGLSNTYILKESYFNSIYDSFQKSIGNGEKSYFTSSDYELCYWAIGKLASGSRTSLATLYGAYSDSNSNAAESFKIVETPAEFPGGNGALGSYLSENMKYPDDARTLGVEGKVIVSFMVAKNGAIEDVSLTRGVYKSLDEEAIRLVKNMPAWEPGTQRGEAVKVKHALPINFRLQ